MLLFESDRRCFLCEEGLRDLEEGKLFSDFVEFDWLIMIVQMKSMQELQEILALPASTKLEPMTFWV